ncbi:hypothetical protein [Streptomyces sp. MMBL 11-3]|uniref:hypothetical protein n=1 Tax=Streptomyces sp. MMBL 11-3 TaxID=3382639 RepID=UPI0039B48540
MLATAERVRGTNGQSDTVLWHKSAGRCNGDCDFHAIACSTEDGIVLPGPVQNVPLDLAKAGERWCLDCLAIIRAARSAKD